MDWLSFMWGFLLAATIYMGLWAWDSKIIGWHHQEEIRELSKRPIGKLVSIEEDERGLVVKGQLFEGIAFPMDKDLGALSIGPNLVAEPGAFRLGTEDTEEDRRRALDHIDKTWCPGNIYGAIASEHCLVPAIPHGPHPLGKVTHHGESGSEGQSDS